MDERTSGAAVDTIVDTKLRYYINETPNAPYVFLSGSRITDMNPLLPYLARLQHMLSLDLSDNRIVSLPSGTSLATCMPRLRALDLSGNPLDVSEDLVRSVLPLRNLSSLCLQFPNAKVAEWVVKCLPQLLFVNGVKVRSPVSQSGDRETADVKELSGLEVRGLHKVSYPHESSLKPYRSLQACIHALQVIQGRSPLGMQGAEGNSDADPDLYVDQKLWKGLSEASTAYTRLEWERKLFSRLFHEAAEVIERAVHAGNHGIQRDNGILEATTRVLRELYRCHCRLEESLVASRSVVSDEGGGRKLQLDVEVSLKPRERSTPEHMVDRPRLSLLSVLCLIQRMVWSKQRKEEERRRGEPWNGCFYYDTMREHMFIFFVELNPRAVETEIVAHVTEFVDSLAYYAKVENCLEAYVFAHIIDNVIEESYWSLFESLCRTIASVIEHVAHLALDGDSGFDVKDVESERGLGYRQYMRYGFLCKEHVVRVIDTLIPVEQRDALLHIDLLEASLSLLAAIGSESKSHQGPIITTDSLLQSLCRVFVKHHECSIYPIVLAFRTVAGATASVGVVNVVELRNILSLLDLPGAKTPEFFAQVHKTVCGSLGDANITFSAIVESVRRMIRRNPPFA